MIQECGKNAFTKKFYNKKVKADSTYQHFVDHVVDLIPQSPVVSNKSE
jgi:hypothetical protein